MQYDAVNKIITIKKDMRNLIWIQLYFTAVYGFLRDILRFPSSISYLLDILLIGMIVYSVIRSRFFKRNTKQYYFLLGMVIVFILTTIFGFLINGHSGLLYLWGFRLTFRFYLFFFLCAVYFQQEDLIKMINFIERIFYLNVVTATLELLLGFQGDNIGGLSGVMTGGNGDLNVIMVLITAITIVQYLSKNTSLLNLCKVILCCLYLMSIAELKVYVFELPFILLVAILNERFTLRKIGVVIIGIVGLGLGISLLGFFFPTSGLDFFISDAISQYMGNDGYTGQGDFSRLNAVMKSQELFLENNILWTLFGLGLGNCSYSGFSFLSSDFYDLFQELHYQWFTDSMIILETGWIGLIIFEGFFVALFLISIWYRRKYDSKSTEYVIIKFITILSLCCIIISVYNISLKMEISYLLYGCMSTILVTLRKDNYKTVSLDCKQLSNYGG